MTRRGLRTKDELVAITESMEPVYGALVALGAGAAWAPECERADLRDVLLYQYPRTAEGGRFDFAEQRDRLRGFLVELGPTLDADLRGLTEAVLAQIARAAEHQADASAQP